MTIIVNSGSTLTVPSTGLTLTADSTIAAGRILKGLSGGTITGGFDLTNDGIILANIPSGLTIDTGSFTNQGTVFYAGSTLVVQSSVNITNLSDGTLTGGTWELGGAGFHLLDGTISTVNATLNFDGGGAVEVGPGGTGTQLISNTLTEVGTSGILTVAGGDWATPGSLNVDGTFNFFGDTLSATGGVTVSATGTMSAADGEIVSPLTVDGSLIVPDDLQLDSTVSGTGSIAVSGGELFLQSPGTLVVTGPGLARVRIMLDKRAADRMCFERTIRAPTGIAWL